MDVEALNESIKNAVKRIKENTNIKEQIKEAEERAKEEIERELYYITEENRQLRKKVREGQAAEEKLFKNERRVMELMTCYLGMKREEF